MGNAGFETSTTTITWVLNAIASYPEVQQGVAVVGGEVGLGLVVIGVYAVEGGVDLGLDGVEGIEDALGAVQVPARGFEVAQVQPYAGHGDGGVDAGIL